jgi:hypothetical protein
VSGSMSGSLAAETLQNGCSATAGLILGLWAMAGTHTHWVGSRHPSGTQSPLPAAHCLLPTGAAAMVESQGVSQRLAMWH